MNERKKNGHKEKTTTNKTKTKNPEQFTQNRTRVTYELIRSTHPHRQTQTAKVNKLPFQTNNVNELKCYGHDA